MYLLVALTLFNDVIRLYYPCLHDVKYTPHTVKYYTPVLPSYYFYILLIIMKSERMYTKLIQRQKRMFPYAEENVPTFHLFLANPFTSS